MDLENGQATVKMPSPPSNLRQRPPSSWVPYAGSKRKAHVANLGDQFDADCRPSPAKQFAVDEDVAPDILRDGFFYDPSAPQPPPCVNENQPPCDEVEMEETIPGVPSTGGFMKGLGEATITSCGSMSMSEKALVDEKECSDESEVTPHSVHESQPTSSSIQNSRHSVIANAFSLILSNEIQETLTRKKQNEDFILPKSIVDQVSGMKMNMSMALVPWKPPTKVETFLHQQTILKEKSSEKAASTSPQLPDPEIQPFNSIPRGIDLQPQTNEQIFAMEPGEDEVEGMDLDIS